MTDDNGRTTLSPTVLRVIDHFISALKEDSDIGVEAADRLQKLLRHGATPKSDEINGALFNDSQEDK